MTGRDPTGAGLHHESTLLPAVVGAVVLASLAILVGAGPGPVSAGMISGALALGCAVVLWAPRSRPVAPLQFLRWIGAAMAIWGLGRLLTGLNSTGPGASFPSLSDLVCFSAAPVAMYGILLLPPAAGGARPRVRVLLDASLIGVSTALLVWRFGFRDLLTPLDVPNAVAMVGLLADIAVLGMAVVVAVRDLDRGMVMVAAGSVAFAVGDLVALHGRVGEDAVPSAGIPDATAVLWLLAWPVITAGVRSHARARLAGEDRGALVVDPDARVVVVSTTLGLLLLGLDLAGMIIDPAGLLEPEGGRIDAVSWWLILTAVACLWVRELLNDRLRGRLLSRLHDEATSDPLTGLANRRMLVAHLAQIGKGEEWCLLALDLDGFKGVNDLLGHTVGDRLLCAVAARLRDGLAPGALACRIGGDEFAVLMPGSLRDGAAVAEVVASAVRRACGDVEGVHRLPVSASVGVAGVIPARGGQGAAPGQQGADASGPGLLRGTGSDSERGPDPLAALSAAGVALQMAKASGRGRVEVFDQRAALLRRRRLSVEERLRAAVAAGDIDVHFQPIVELASGRVTGVEALARWADRQLGTIDPCEFIPVAEQTGLVVALGELVLESSVEQATRLELVSRGVRVSCNVSPLQLRVPGFFGTVQQVLTRYGMPPQALVVEVTEAVLVEEAGVAMATLRDLAEAGVTIAIDDFGTGYSALGYLRRLPADILKIDRSLTCSLLEEGRARAITRAVIDLGRNIGMSIVVEGIETPEVGTLIQRMGAGYGQGLLYGPARPLEELIALHDRMSQPA